MLYICVFLYALIGGSLSYECLERKGQEERGVEGGNGKVRVGKKNERETWLVGQEEGPATLNVDHNLC